MDAQGRIGWWLSSRDRLSSAKTGAHDKTMLHYHLYNPLFSKIKVGGKDLRGKIVKLPGNGVDLVTTANELGHANATTTAMIYAHQIAIAKARAADVRAGVFAGRDSKPKGSKLRSKFRGA